MTDGGPDDELLLVDRDDKRTPSLENRVARQWELPPDSLALRSGYLRDSTLLGWMVEELRRPASSPASALDVGCAFGNHLFMLDRALDLDPSIRLVGVDLSDHGLPYARAFAEQVPGYGNCEFHQADLIGGLPFADETFRVVALSDVIEHLDDPVAALRELTRVTVPGGAVLVSTPVRDSLVKRIATAADKAVRGRLSAAYYEGKGVLLDEHGHPTMHVDAGHDHISEMTVPELLDAGRRAGLRPDDVASMTLISGSAWFDRHPTLLAGVLVAESVHQKLQRPSWGHGVCVRFRTA